jgi:hypothetical protein
MEWNGMPGYSCCGVVGAMVGTEGGWLERIMSGMKQLGAMGIYRQ